jgi:putative flavoprotein involved in K+ transport
VVWATGYRDDTAWVGIPGAVARDGSFAHREGVSPVPGLFFVGRPWQRNRASALVMGAGDDAGRIVQAIAAASAPVASWAAA